jgi:class 3 adenylate cyclase
MTTDDKRQTTNNMDELLEERARLDKMLNEQFTRLITVMFTDLKGSTSIAESAGDLAARTMIKHHNDIVLPLIKEHNGVLVKTMGDGTMSYFDAAQDAVRAASGIQAAIDRFNLGKTLPQPILIRIGLHTGKGIVEENDIFGDVVNVASRFESSANPGEIYLSEETYNSLTNKGEIYCRFIKTTELKGKKEPFKIYKAFWNPKEAETDMSSKRPASEETGKKGSPVVRILLILIPAAILIFGIIKGLDLFKSGNTEETRSKEHRITVPAK